ncbi:major facilitator superfamily domain-containing protein 9-like isoform X1 [Maniola hyperantus]|uniref:major facilitator superfamily domain-containing protein 9-like isoform X1 n=2 Tax=Aphantopus hyperantus TaxID=2795564 RepID=UPI00156858A4|nr:major facilitator superfamily domain-containing protein 9-like [Maniola hyperantus]
MSFSVPLLQCVASLDLFAVGLIVPLIPNHVRQMGVNHIYIGLLGSIYACFQLWSGPVIGSLSDLKGRKQILFLTLIVCCVAYLILGGTNSIAIMLLMRAVLGIFKQTQLLTKALVPDYERDEKKQSVIYGKMAAISGVGITIGPVVGGHIVEDHPIHGFSIAAVLVSICFFVNACLVYMLPKVNIPVRRKSDPTTSSHSILQSLLSCSKQSFVQLSKVEWSKYWTIFIFQALNSFAMSVYFSNYALYLKSQYGLSPKHIGYVVSIQGVIGVISSFMMGYINSFYIHDKDYSVRNYHVFILLSASLLGICLSINIVMYTALLIPLAIGNAVGRLVTLEMVLKRSHGDHRGTLIGASNSVRSLSGVVAPLVAGFVGEFFGVAYVIYASFCSTFIGLIMSFHYKTKLLKVD